MSLEAKIDTLNANIVALIAALTAAAPAQPATPPQFAAATVPVAQQPMTVAAAPAADPNVLPNFAAPAAVMPPGPTFAAPVAAAPAVPFTDLAGLVKFAMDAYATLGAEKGAQIQNIIASLGVQNINDVKPEQYAAFYTAVQALKGA